MIYAGTFNAHFLCWYELDSTFRNLDNNHSCLNIHKYYGDITSIVFIDRIWRDNHNIGLDVIVDRNKILPEDINTIGRLIVSFFTVSLKRFNGRVNKKIYRYETDGVHLTFTKSIKSQRKLV